MLDQLDAVFAATNTVMVFFAIVLLANTLILGFVAYRVMALDVITDEEWEHQQEALARVFDYEVERAAR